MSAIDWYERSFVETVTANGQFVMTASRHVDAGPAAAGGGINGSSRRLHATSNRGGAR